MTQPLALAAQRRKEGAGALLRTTLHGSAGHVGQELSRTVEELEDAPLSPTLLQTEAGLTFLEPIPPCARLIVLGGGHIALALCEMAAACGFSVTVVDDRPDFADPSRFPQATHTLCMPFQEAVSALKLTEWDYVAVLTRGHAHDGDCLRALLAGTAPAYLGMIGSRRRVAAQLRLLAEEGYDPDTLGRICTPIGLAIGAVTPAEIAVSILAQLIARRRQGAYAFREGRQFVTDLQGEVLEELSACPEPLAVVTVLAADGSTPRGAGARLAITAGGRLIGTIGGGLAEGAAIREASELIGTGRFALRTFDMTAAAAAREGMACGGRMTVLMEDLSNFYHP